MGRARGGMRARIAGWLFLVLASAWAVPAVAQRWVPIGPDGGDVRSLTYDPTRENRIYLGTSSGQLFVSTDNGESWVRLAHLGEGDDTVIDHIAIDPQTGTLFAATWRADQNSDGDLFRSDDHGKSWQVVPGLRGKSIRSFAMSPSRPQILVAGALDGVYRSYNQGATWERISPENHAEIKNVESLAIDPEDPGLIYAGTWHLPWKTADGGETWHSIKNGVIDDSDVFSIIVSRDKAAVVYASACSGIYKSENYGEEFRKVQGIPDTARRTRVLRQDLHDPAVVFAGTTEGLWRTGDSGRTWQRVTARNFIVNDVLIDPRDPSHVLVATDRSGVLLSHDGGRTFGYSNRGFTHRRVASLVVDRSAPSVLYAGVLNDKEFGGVFVSADGGYRWRQRSTGLGTRDVFVLAQMDDGALLAGTNNGVFQYSAERRTWEASGAGTLQGRVYDLESASGRVYAATSLGLLVSDDHARIWRRVDTGVEGQVIAVRATGHNVAAITPSRLVASSDQGRSWYEAKLPSYVAKLNGLAIEGGSVLWVATREGALRSADGGQTWEHVLDGLPHSQLLSIVYDARGRRLLATAEGTHNIFVSSDGGRNWRPENAGYSLRSVVAAQGRVLASTAYDGVLLRTEDGSLSRSVGAAGSEP